ncbi:LOW QUALITY PROTEIN: hypothetical protein NC651_024170 [Populus alba x Populus x berolinensis]|nr:LOW QUALITY PROTEIN: hypothetical protein NC651_024170 [Populus alba x Populus x berolinensis]
MVAPAKFFEFLLLMGDAMQSAVMIPKKKSFKHGTWMIVTKTRLPHHREPNEFVFGPTFWNCLKVKIEWDYQIVTILSWRLDADDYETDEELKKIHEERGYSCVDICEVFPEKLPNYEEKIKDFFEEHFHTDEEIRYCVSGSGYFDVRDHNDRWIRVWVKKGGMIVLPAGIYQVVRGSGSPISKKKTWHVVGTIANPVPTFSVLHLQGMSTKRVVMLSDGREESSSKMALPCYFYNGAPLPLLAVRYIAWFDMDSTMIRH